MPLIRAYSANRYVIGVRTDTGSYKLFQISFGRDSSIYVTFPYYVSAAGQFGIVQLGPGSGHGESVKIGDDFHATAHQVKYSHHLSGQAHFSLTGKVKAEARKAGVPLRESNGHVFTVMLQGAHHFTATSDQDQGTKKRGVVIFGLEGIPADAIKFLGMIYPERVVARMARHPEPTPWMKVVAPDGSIRPGLFLCTPIIADGQRFYLMLTAENIARINTQQEVFLSLMGGFDAAEIALDRRKSTSFLMFIYPSPTSYENLRGLFQAADIAAGP